MKKKFFLKRKKKDKIIKYFLLFLWNCRLSVEEERIVEFLVPFGTVIQTVTVITKYLLTDFDVSDAFNA